MKIKDLIQKKDWKAIVDKYQPAEITSLLSFRDAMILANSLFVKNHSDPSIEEFAINLLFKIKDVYPTEWEEDWKNNIYLAELCSITWRDKEAFELHNQTYNKFSDPPDAAGRKLAACDLGSKPVCTARAG